MVGGSCTVEEGAVVTHNADLCVAPRYSPVLWLEYQFMSGFSKSADSKPVWQRAIGRITVLEKRGLNAIIGSYQLNAHLITRECPGN